MPSFLVRSYCPLPLLLRREPAFSVTGLTCPYLSPFTILSHPGLLPIRVGDLRKQPALEPDCHCRQEPKEIHSGQKVSINYNSSELRRLCSQTEEAEQRVLLSSFRHGLPAAALARLGNGSRCPGATLGISSQLRRGLCWRRTRQDHRAYCRAGHRPPAGPSQGAHLLASLSVESKTIRTEVYFSNSAFLVVKCFIFPHL